MYQQCLIPPESIPPRVKHDKLFENLPEIPGKRSQHGRPPISKDSLLKGLIYRNLRGIDKLVELEFELLNNPSMAEPLGLDPLKKPPSDERFSEFLRSNPNGYFQIVRKSLIEELINEDVISGTGIGFDSCPIEATVKENNLKASIKDRYDKNRLVSGDKDARLGVSIHFPTPFKKEIHYFWGYRNHIINDLKSGLPLWEITLQANKSEKPVGLSMLKELHQHFLLPIEVVAGDASYDVEDILKYIIEQMKAEAMIPRNPGNTQNTPYTVKKEKVYCQADLPMYRKGKMTNNKGVTYCKYSCPLHWSKEFRGSYLLCPAGHPKFLTQKGCNVLIRLTPSVREKINYGTKRFKDVYNQRTSVERVFSRLLSISMQKPTVKGLRAVRNHCTIAHITVLLVALTAHRMGCEDKIRFVKSFVPNFLTS
ncbi:MAG: transposase [Deltaproteobacteria bacterium]|nr:transposase [Deltaproteobacteria bacterium]